ncbi:hypothetical protein [Ancylobacter defluvii]|uniref:Uncharacterized protein n=1 Tax=Ancylobacter defluvii TaxID=1282440 RepID=A0A9W6NCM8_9HYPH|nr:hypothetical protein [Ancylobacter defluvii]MBS7586523.1 hypothetical protein [Ancylobacter defluvii]GLK85810.1 hypothetical protein GCM10017653_38800 [Ancylobacter defluvii]
MSAAEVRVAGGIGLVGSLNKVLTASGFLPVNVEHMSRAKPAIRSHAWRPQ